MNRVYQKRTVKLNIVYHRTLRQSSAQWHIALQNSSMSRQASRWTRKWTSGYVSLRCIAAFSYQSSVQSLGCTLFALAYSHSPFENLQTTEQGGSIAMAVMNAQYKHPESAYSQGLKNLIDSMLKVNPAERPDIHEVGAAKI